VGETATGSNSLFIEQAESGVAQLALSASCANSEGFRTPFSEVGSAYCGPYHSTDGLNSQLPLSGEWSSSIAVHHDTDFVEEGVSLQCKFTSAHSGW
jgi:hypothetical protein